MATKKVLDFSQVKDQSGFNPKHKPDGEYLGKIVSFEDTKSKSGNEMWVFGIQLATDRKAVYPQYCLLQPEHLWKLRSLMMACGIAVPKKKLSVDGNRLIGKDVGICLETDEYEGKMKSTVSSFFPASEFEGDHGSEDDHDEDEAEEEEYEDDEPEDETPADDDSDEDDSDDSDDEPEDEEDAEEDDEEEEPEPEPAKKAAPAARRAPAGRKRRAPAKVEEEDELDVDDL